MLKQRLSTGLPALIKAMLTATTDRQVTTARQVHTLATLIPIQVRHHIMAHPALM
jgi:hypothetical protein